MLEEIKRAYDKAGIKIISTIHARVYRRLHSRERSAQAILEYGMIFAVVVGLIVVLKKFSNEIQQKFETAIKTLNS